MASGWTLPDLLKMDSIFPHAPLKGSAAQRATRRFLEFTLLTLIAGALGFSIPIIAIPAFLVIGTLSLGSSTPKHLPDPYYLPSFLAKTSGVFFALFSTFFAFHKISLITIFLLLYFYFIGYISGWMKIRKKHRITWVILGVTFMVIFLITPFFYIFTSIYIFFFMHHTKQHLKGFENHSKYLAISLLFISIFYLYRNDLSIQSMNAEPPMNFDFQRRKKPNRFLKEEKSTYCQAYPIFQEAKKAFPENLSNKFREMFKNHHYWSIGPEQCLETKNESGKDRFILWGHHGDDGIPVAIDYSPSESRLAIHHLNPELRWNTCTFHENHIYCQYQAKQYFESPEETWKWLLISASEGKKAKQSQNSPQTE